MLEPTLNYESNSRHEIKESSGRFDPYIKLLSILLFLIGLILSNNVYTQNESDTKLDKEKRLVANIPSEQHQNILYILLTAEMAASRNLQSQAVNGYLNAAKTTKDAAIAEQSTIISVNLQAPAEAVQSAVLWANAAPENLQAQIIALTLLIGPSPNLAEAFLKRALEINSMQVEQHIVEIQTRLSDNSAKNLKDALNQIATNKPNNAYIQLAAAQSSAEQGDIQGALQRIENALGTMPDLTRALQLKARLISFEKKSDLPALEFLSAHLEKFPQNAELRLFYANALIDNEKRDEAKKELLKITDHKITGGFALVFLGEIYLKESNWKDADQALKKAMLFPETRENAQHMLGENEELQGHHDSALEWYTQVGPSAFHVPATLRAVLLLKQKKEYADAIYLLHNSTPVTLEEQKQLLLAEMDILNASQRPENTLDLANEVLAKIPGDSDVLYMRAITATKLKKWDMAEADLKKVLKQNPNNANALNALGFTLSFHKDRIKEALHYINQALAIAPNNPDFIDSLGWTYYRAGDIPKALTYLKKANELSNDASIAAHFGEVLWMNNQKDLAMDVWKKALNKLDAEELKETLNRLKVDLK